MTNQYEYTYEDPIRFGEIKSTSQFRVLRGLKYFDRLDGTESKPKSLNLVDKILNNPNIQIVFVCGEPGIGKTTILDEIAIALKIKDPKIKVRQKFYDDILAQTEAYPHESNSWTDDPEDPGWNRFCNNMIADIEKEEPDAMQETKTSFTREVILVEMVGIATRKNRGKKVINKYVQENPEAVMVVAVATDPRTLNLSLNLRDLILRMDPKIIEEKLKTTFNISVKWFGKKPKSEEEQGEKMKKIASKMASSKEMFMLIEDVNREEEELGITYADQEVRDLVKKLLTVSALKGREGEAGFIARRILYLEFKLGIPLYYGLPEENAIVAINPHTRKRKTWFIHNQ